MTRLKPEYTNGLQARIHGAQKILSEKRSSALVARSHSTDERQRAMLAGKAAAYVEAISLLRKIERGTTFKRKRWFA